MSGNRNRLGAHKLSSLICLVAMAVAGPAVAQSNFQGSEGISVGTMSILSAPLASVSGKEGPSVGLLLSAIGGAYVVTGVVDLGRESVEVILDAFQGAGKLSVKLAKSTVNTVGASVGTAVQVSAEATGTLLVASGKVLAFIPNTVGESLLYHSRVPGTSPTQ